MQRDGAAMLAGGAVLAAALTGASQGPQHPAAAAWYAMLRKPSYTPPGPAIGAAWGVLELLLAASGYRLLQARAAPPRTVALTGWALCLAGLAGFPWAMFGRRRLDTSTAISAAMLASAAATAAAGQRVDRPAAAMTLPLLAWLGFATVLSEELWRRNAADRAL